MLADPAVSEAPPEPSSERPRSSAHYMPKIPRGLGWRPKDIEKSRWDADEPYHPTSSGKSNSGALKVTFLLGIGLLALAGLIKGAQHYFLVGEDGFVPKTSASIGGKVEPPPTAASEQKEANPSTPEQLFERASALRRDRDKSQSKQAEAARLYEAAAKQGHAGAQNAMGWLFAEGEGVEQDHVQSAEWFLKAARQGQARSQNRVGILYFRGLGVRKDPAEALRWFRAAAEKDNRVASHNVGVMLDDGLTGESDHVEAVRWFRKAAELGYVKSQYRLGRNYYWGTGVEKDDDEAVYWVRKAANNGYAEAQSLFGHFYIQGSGVEKDFLMAYMWYTVAIEGNAKNAQANRDGIIEKLTVAEIEKAERLAVEWLAAHKK